MGLCLALDLAYASVLFKFGSQSSSNVESIGPTHLHNRAFKGQPFLIPTEIQQQNKTTSKKRINETRMSLKCCWFLCSGGCLATQQPACGCDFNPGRNRNMSLSTRKRARGLRQRQGKRAELLACYQCGIKVPSKLAGEVMLRSQSALGDQRSPSASARSFGARQSPQSKSGCRNPMP